jgi:hypothetical protein
MKKGYVCLGFQSINVIMVDSNQLNQFWMFCLGINQKGMQYYLDILEWHIFIWSAQTLLKNQIMSLFAAMSPILFFNPLECNFVIIKINLIVLINTFVLWKNPKF